MRVSMFCWMVGMGWLVTSCSLIVDDKAEQCSRDSECASFGDTYCDRVTATCRLRLLVSPDEWVPQVDAGRAPTAPRDGGQEAGQDASVRPSTAASATPEAGTVRPPAEDAGCRARTEPPSLNACTNAHCRPFDNRARLTKLTADGGLPPLPPLPARDASTEIN
jgi:hypothetical protein